jgi:hypothetical protein
MLNRGVDKVDYNAENKVCGVYSGGEYASCRFIVADPSYFPEKTRHIGKVFIFRLLWLKRKQFRSGHSLLLYIERGTSPYEGLNFLSNYYSTSTSVASS